MNDRKLQRVAKAICEAAGSYYAPDAVCRVCEGRGCTMWSEFMKEAIAALRATKGV